MLSFHKFPRDVSLKNGSILSRERILFPVSSTINAQHIHGTRRQGRSDIPIIFPLLQSKQRSLQKSAKMKKIETGQSKTLADADVKEVGFFVWICQFQ